MAPKDVLEAGEAGSLPSERSVASAQSKQGAPVPTCWEGGQANCRTQGPSAAVGVTLRDPPSTALGLWLAHQTVHFHCASSFDPWFTNSVVCSHSRSYCLQDLRRLKWWRLALWPRMWSRLGHWALERSIFLHTVCTRHSGQVSL